MTQIEQLEADLAAMTAERDQWKQTAEQFGETASEFMGLYNAKATEIMKNECEACKEMAPAHAESAIQSRDAALARVAELEAQRDQARRMFCEAESVCSEGVKTARDEALVYWPAQADSLYPPDGR